MRRSAFLAFLLVAVVVNLADWPTADELFGGGLAKQECRGLLDNDDGDDAKTPTREEAKPPRIQAAQALPRITGSFAPDAAPTRYSVFLGLPPAAAPPRAHHAGGSTA